MARMRAVDAAVLVLEKEGIPTRIFALEATRPNLVARLRGNGKKRPLLIMGHTDVVNVDPAKWTFPPFGATRDGGYIYGRGSLDDRPRLGRHDGRSVESRRGSVRDLRRAAGAAGRRRVESGDRAAEGLRAIDAAGA